MPEIEDGLFGYLHGIVENNKSKLILVNGTANHVHLLISLGKVISISELVGDIKRDSSVWKKLRILNSRVFTGRKVTERFQSGKLKLKM